MAAAGAGRSIEDTVLITRMTSVPGPFNEGDAEGLHAQWPTTEALERRLSDALSGGVRVAPRVVTRTPNSFSSTFPTEIVTCRIGSEPLLGLFCKHFHSHLGQQFGKGARPFHEIEVYEHILAKIPWPTPEFLGSWISDDAREGLLVLEYLDKSRRLGHTRDYDNGLEDAATWIGNFHRHASVMVSQPQLGFLRKAGAQSYRDLLARMMSNRGLQSERPAWLGRLSDVFQLVTGILEDADLTVIHGEYYPKNVLVHEGRIVPVDWETASLGMGEMDLATLVDGWPRAMDRCVTAYAAARGFSAGDHRFRERLAVGQILVNIYWLGYSSGGTADPQQVAKATRRLDQLRLAAEQLGVL
jgi:thiamine kinase-like enzyme